MFSSIGTRSTFTVQVRRTDNYARTFSLNKLPGVKNPASPLGVPSSSPLKVETDHMIQGRLKAKADARANVEMKAGLWAKLKLNGLFEFYAKVYFSGKV